MSTCLNACTRFTGSTATEQVRVAAALLDSLPGLGQLDLLDALGSDQECDLLSVQRHASIPSP